MSVLETAVRRLRSSLGLSHEAWAVRASRPIYDGLLQLMYGRRGLKRRIHDEAPIRILPRYRSIGEDGEPQVFFAMKEQLQPGQTVLDIGANVGVYSMLMARWVGAAGTVYAFEPAPESCTALRQHVILNGLKDRVEVIPSAISDTVGEATFFAATYDGQNSMNPAFARRVMSSKPVRVPVTTIDEFCRTRDVRPSFIKIDIEGYEFHALRGAVETLQKCRPTLLVELHPAVWEELGVESNSLESMMAQLRYKSHDVDQTHVMLIPELSRSRSDGARDDCKVD